MKMNARNVLLLGISAAFVYLIYALWSAFHGGPQGPDGITVKPVVQSEQQSNDFPRVVLQVGHSGRVDTATFSRDGHLLVSGGTDPFAVVWNVDTGSVLTHLMHASEIKDGCFSGNAEFIALGGGSKATVWRIDGTLVTAVDLGKQYDVTCVELSEDGNRLLIGTAQGKIREVECRTKQHRDFAPFREQLPQIGKVGYATNESEIIVLGNDCRVLDASSGDTRLVIDGHESKVLAARLDRRRSRMYTVSSDDTIRSWNIETRDELTRLEGTLRPQRARMKNAENGEWDKILIEYGFGFQHAAIASEPPLLVTAAARNVGSEVVLWNHASQQLVWKWDNRDKSVNSVAITADGRRVVTGFNTSSWIQFDRLSESARVWNFDGEELKSTVELRSVAAPGACVAFSPDGLRLAVAASNGSLEVWNLKTGSRERRFQVKANLDSCVFRSNNELASTGYNDQLRLWDIEHNKELPQQIRHFKPGAVALAVLDDSVLSSGESPWMHDITKGTESVFICELSGEDRRSSMGLDYETVVISRDGKHAAMSGQFVRMWDVEKKQLVFAPRYGSGSGLAFSDDSKRLFIGDFNDSTIRVVDVALRQIVRNLDTPVKGISCMVLLPHSNRVLLGGRYGRMVLYDIDLERTILEFDGHSHRVKSIGVDPKGQLVATTSFDGEVRLWRPSQPHPLARLLGSKDGAMVVSADFRLDFEVETPQSRVHWVFPDEPTRELNPELFLRDYYEPKLLSRLLKGETFSVPRRLSLLNRVQPIVMVTGATARMNDLVAISVEVCPAEARFRRDAKDVVMRTDAYDLRLFRNGQLVGRWPEPSDDGEAKFDPDPTNAADMQKWRELNRVKADGQRVIAGTDGKMTVSFPVRLPSRPEPGPVEFTAYAFNEDRVKSETARFTYQASAQPSTRKPRAYLVCVGVSACQTKAWDLAFAAKDAQAIAASLDRALKDRYDVVPVVLTSQYTEEGTVASAIATKENVQAVLKLLAGKSVKPETLKRLPHGGQLQMATPDDLVLVSFSGQGYTDTRGTLHLIPHDVGRGQKSVTNAQSRCISSGELSAWLRGIDAGETVLVVDACHSAAAIAEPGFKPGPLGNRGLGQLAYDKGMRVLAAAQGDDVALESRKVKPGLLTYALVRDGLEQRRAAKDGKITLGGLLTYAAERVPGLYEEVVAGKVKDAAGENAKDVAGVQPKDPNKSRVQRPELFDYAKKQAEIPLVTN